MASVARNTVLLLVLIGVVLQMGSVVPAEAAGRMLADKVAGGGGGGEATDRARSLLVDAEASVGDVDGSVQADPLLDGLDLGQLTGGNNVDP
ncbi:hypothetical protein D1007_14280 [Hordeum vulgare]|nr:hypothetical protein D1007_14280 [Hordeum vulgare]